MLGHNRDLGSTHTENENTNRKESAHDVYVENPKPCSAEKTLNPALIPVERVWTDDLNRAKEGFTLVYAL